MIKIILIIMAVFILYCMIETAKRTAGFPSDEVPDLFAEIKWNQKTKKIIFLSDLHNRMYGKEMNACWKASKQHPDLILIGGYVGQKGWQIPMTGRYASWKNCRQSARSTVRMVIMNRN